LRPGFHAAWAFASKMWHATILRASKQPGVVSCTINHVTLLTGRRTVTTAHPGHRRQCQ
jgi:hypothetical protein